MDLKAEERAFWEELRKKLAAPPTEEELEERRRFAREADRLRVKVGRDFNIVAEIRRMRDQGE
ncbi:MAG TPA: hypothetical protein VG370_21005 [Chloroflexota bacterium]|nr:hypothetical protein [Chloroflexota bacterium]